MKKIIFITTLIALTGCSQSNIKSADLSIQQPPAFRYSSLNHSARQHSVLHVNGSEQLKDIAQEEGLFPSILNKVKQGVASWYGPGFHGKKTATGEIFDMNAMTAAHKTLGFKWLFEHSATHQVRCNWTG